jgi:hypothetical protein
MLTRAVKETPLLSECDFAVGQDSPKDILAYYARLREYVEHEDGLINSRLTWSLTIHGFLFAFFGILAGKCVDLLTALHQHPAAKSPDPLLSSILGLWVVLAIVALVGFSVGYFSREAIVGAHNALLHLSVLAHKCGPLQIPPAMTTSNDSIPSGKCTVTPASMAGISSGSALLIVGTETQASGGGKSARPSEEIVTVSSKTNDSFDATFTGARQAPVTIIPLGGVLLPGIVRGGARLKHTWRTSRFYLGLPVVMMIAWALLFVLIPLFLYVQVRGLPHATLSDPGISFF